MNATQKHFRLYAHYVTLSLTNSMRPYPRPHLGITRTQSSLNLMEAPETQQIQGCSISAPSMITKNQFIDQLQPITCSICLDHYDREHVPVQLSCGHIFGDHCIVKQTEFKTANNNRCPLCRQELFEQEDFGSGGDALYSGDEALVDSDDFDDSTDDEGMETDDERYWQTLAALLDAPQARHAHLADPSLGTITDPVEERRQSANVLEVIDPSAERVERHNRHVEFSEHTARRRNMSRTSIRKLPGRTSTYNQIASDAETGTDWSGSEYEPEDDLESTDETGDKRAYRLLPGEHGTTLPAQSDPSS